MCHRLVRTRFCAHVWTLPHTPSSTDKHCSISRLPTYGSDCFRSEGSRVFFPARQQVVMSKIKHAWFYVFFFLYRFIQIKVPVLLCALGLWFMKPHILLQHQRLWRNSYRWFSHPGSSSRTEFGLHCTQFAATVFTHIDRIYLQLSNV